MNFLLGGPQPVIVKLFIYLPDYCMYFTADVLYLLIVSMRISSPAISRLLSSALTTMYLVATLFVHQSLMA